MHTEIDRLENGGFVVRFYFDSGIKRTSVVFTDLMSAYWYSRKCAALHRIVEVKGAGVGYV